MDNSQKTPFTSPHLLSNKEISDLGVKEHDIELYRRAHYQLQFGVNTWYSKLKEHTFLTTFINLTYEEARAIVAKHIHRHIELDEDQQELLNKLQVQIDDIIQKEFPNGAFIKLNTRSPKDVPLYDVKDANLHSLVEKEVDQIEENERTSNNIVAAWIRATNKSLKVTSGAQAIRMLLKSTRISEDLNRGISFGKKLFQSKIVLREWVDEVVQHPEMEFRCFVHQNKMTAITQYFDWVCFPQLVENQEIIQGRIVSFFEAHVKQRLLSHESYVIDFFVSKDSVKIIELNPFHNGAGAGLFSWRENRELLMNGPLEMRVVLTPLEDPTEVLPAYWQKFINQQIKRKEEKEEIERKMMHYWPWTAATAMFGIILLHFWWKRK